MRIHPFFALAVVGGAVALVSLLWNENKPTNELRARARAPLGTFQQEMYLRLAEAFPELILLAQVAVSALMTAPRKDRARYHHKRADFVLLDRAFKVLAIVQVDDQTQASRHAIGDPTNALLEMAGYRVLELTEIPEVDELRELLPLHAAPPADAP